MRKLSVLITVLMFTMLTVGAQSTIGKHRFISGGAPGCTAGPTANMLLRLDSTTTTPGNITTWVSGVGGITATAVGSGTVTSYANVFGTQPGVRLTAANSQYFLLSSVVNGGASINNLTVMSVVKFNSPTTEQVLTSGASGQGAFTYWVGNSVSWLQGADVQNSVQLGTGTADFFNSTSYQIDVTYNYDTSLLMFGRNGVADATQSASYHPLAQGISIIGSALGSSFYLDGYLGAVYVFSPALSTGDLAAWRTYLACTYGV
jgi:hypothetical protein